MKINTQSLVKSILALAVLGAALVLVQMWLGLFPDEVFLKLLITLVVLGGLLSFIIALAQDLSEEKKLKDDNYIE